jgi:hypothetical protein
MENITVIIKTSEQRRSLFRLLKSLRKHYPRIPIGLETSVPRNSGTGSI